MLTLNCDKSVGLGRSLSLLCTTSGYGAQGTFSVCIESLLKYQPL